MGGAYVIIESFLDLVGDLMQSATVLLLYQHIIVLLYTRTHNKRELVS